MGSIRASAPVAITIISHIGIGSGIVAPIAVQAPLNMVAPTTVVAVTVVAVIVAVAATVAQAISKAKRQAIIWPVVIVVMPTMMLIVIPAVIVIPIASIEVFGTVAAFAPNVPAVNFGQKIGIIKLHAGIATLSR